MFSISRTMGIWFLMLDTEKAGWKDDFDSDMMIEKRRRRERERGKWF